MKPRTLVSLLGFLGITALTAPSAVAADSGWYAGAAVGQSRVRVDTSGIDAQIVAAGFATSATSAKESDAGWKFMAGYQFNRNFGIEAGYVDLGRISTTSVTTGPAATITGDFEGRAWFADVLGHLPLANNFSGYAKVGFHRWDVDAAALAIAGGGVARVAASDTGTNAKFGLGLKYDFSKSLSARAEWERYKSVGNSSTTGKADVDLFSVGLVFRF